MNMQDKVAIVTGAAAMLGSAIVRAFVQAGARVIAVDIDVPRGKALEAELAAELGPRCRFAACDIAPTTRSMRWWPTCCAPRGASTSSSTTRSCTATPG
jgi:NAD(P)-dependent dehydrogenase (short-subunit alcohol dehydrogenase family)